jgi:hypothetical protein
MRKILPVLFLLVFTISLPGQKESSNVYTTSVQKDSERDISNITISIFPVPVRENNFTIKSNRDISSVKITNIIGQDIFRSQYNDPQSLIKILLNNPKRGMYLVTIILSDGTRIVKKILIEEME